MNSAVPVLAVEALEKRFAVRRGFFRRGIAEVHAVNGVSFTVAQGETLCIVGESGCGKSTLGKLVLRLIEPSGGRILVEGQDVTRLDAAAMRPWRRRVQMVFQDPYASLNPRLSAEKIVVEPVGNFRHLGRAERRERAAQLLARVGLRSDALDRFPFEFSGGQRQRLAIARALSLQPALIVADEPVSALDVSVQAQVLNLLLDLQEEYGLAYLFISHDLGVVEHVAHRIAVMYLGRIVELATRDALFAAPTHPYSEALLAAAPIPDPRIPRLAASVQGEVPSPIDPPAGCAFHPRCPLAVARCRSEIPALAPLPDGSLVACHVRAPTSASAGCCPARPRSSAAEAAL
ncbi:MAG: dipeptide ABC transporter ATP-binding protein [Acidisphaera sp.]|nr:dipeptide ABC transporter ATP-binding protein [Acidisphaera sp.]